MRLSYRQKNQVMGGVAVVLLVLVLGIPVRQTVTLTRQNAQLEQQAQRVRRAPEQITRLKTRSVQLGEVLAIGAETNALRKELFAHAGMHCQQHQVRLQSVREAEHFVEGELTVETHCLELEGRFVDQLRVCRALDQQLQRGRLASVVFRTTYDRRTQRTYLNGQLFIQGVKESDNEEL